MFRDTNTSYQIGPKTSYISPRSLADDLGGVDEVVEDGGVDGHEGAGDGPLLLQLVRLPRRLRQDAALGDEDHVLPGKLLLQLAHEPENWRRKYLVKELSSWLQLQSHSRWGQSLFFVTCEIVLDCYDYCLSHTGGSISFL